MRHISEQEFLAINRRIVNARQTEPERIGPTIREILRDAESARRGLDSARPNCVMSQQAGKPKPKVLEISQDRKK